MAMLNRQMVNLHFPVIFFCVSYDFPIFLWVFPWYFPFSYDFPMVYLGFPMELPFSYGFSSTWKIPWWVNLHPTEEGEAFAPVPARSIRAGHRLAAPWVTRLASPRIASLWQVIGDESSMNLGEFTMLIWGIYEEYHGYIWLSKW